METRSNARQATAWISGIEDGKDVLLCALPFFHSYGMLAMNVGVLNAAKLVPVPNPRDLHMVLELISKERATIFPGVPRLYVERDRRLAASHQLERPRDEFDLRARQVAHRRHGVLRVALTICKHRIAILAEGYLNLLQLEVVLREKIGRAWRGARPLDRVLRAAAHDLLQ